MTIGGGSVQQGKRHQRRIVIGFDDETFSQIRRRAERERTSFAEQARLLIEWGLETEHAN